jgi:hypothetical protein
MCCPDLGCFDYVNSNDPNNCGGCGKICPSGSCLYGTCMDSPPVLGIADWDFGCAPNDIDVRVRITDDVGVVSATFNDNAMVLIEGDNKDGVWLYTVDGSDKKLGDCIPATIKAFDTTGQPAGLNFQVCWLIAGC